MAKNILFSGIPETPPSEVFEKARENWSPERRRLEESFERFRKSPENKGILPEDNETGATLEQVYNAIKLLGADKYCLLSTDQEEVSTGNIVKVIKMSSEQLIKSLKQIQVVDGHVLSTLLHYDGHTGHCIVLDWYDEKQNRFFYRDPWPLDSLLCDKNNMAGVNARKEEENYWSVTDDELSSVIFAVFVYPGQWDRAQNELEPLRLDTLKESDFFSFFHLEEISRYDHGNKSEIQYSPSSFKGIVVVSLLMSPTNRISEAILLMNRDWMKQNFMLVPDISRSFLRTFAPDKDMGIIGKIIDALDLGKINQMLPELMQAKQDDVDPVDAFMMSFLGVAQGVDIGFSYSNLSIDNTESNGIPCQMIKMVLP